MEAGDKRVDAVGRQSIKAASTAGSPRALLETWGRLHAVRTVLGIAATLVFLWALH